MQWYKNLKMRNKLFLGFGVLVIFAVVMGAIGFAGINKINDSYRKAMDGVTTNVELSSNLLSAFMQKRLALRNDIIDSYTSATTKMDTNAADMNNGLISTYIGEYKELTDKTPELSSFTLAELDSLESLIQNYNEVSKKIYDFMKDGDLTASMNLLEGDGAKAAEAILSMLDSGYTHATELSGNAIATNEAAAGNVMWQLVAAMLIVIIVSVVLSLYVSGVVVKPIKHLIDSAQKVSDGDLKVSIALNSRDEIGQLSRNFEQVVHVFGSFDDDLKNLYSEFQDEGNIDARFDELKYKGDYQLIAKRIDGIINSLTEDTAGLLGVLTQYGNGNFEATVPKFPGKKALMNETLDELQGNLKAINGDVKSLIDGAQKGELEVRIDDTKYNGDWKRMVSGMNDLLDGVIEPIKETIDVVSEMAKGNLKVSINGDYKGEYLKMKQAVNTTLVTLSKYIDEISFVLDAMSRENFDLEIENEYIGDFAAIKQSLLQIIETFNDVLGNINLSADQVSQGAKQISQSSMMLAQGATEQAGAIDKLTVTLGEVNKKTADNAQNAIEANKLAENAKENAGAGSQEMGAMLSSMAEIEVASKNISKIIKVIEDIAFQTNLLALNAAVEAARAGQHGKGFAVVADQVRSLAGRSKDAAQETTTLIEGTVNKVAIGMTLANKTSKVLESIVSQIGDISNIVSGVANSSNEQAGAINEISDSIGKISFVTQANTATSEQAAASSQELLSQSDVLKDKVSKFKLKNIKRETKAVVANSAKPVVTNSAKPKLSIGSSEKPVVTNSAKPAVTDSVKPVATNSAKPVVANSAKPVVANSAKPVAANTAKPVAVNSAKPVAANTAKPVAANTAKPVVTSSAGAKGNLYQSPVAAKAVTPVQSPSLKPSLPQKAVAQPSSGKEDDVSDSKFVTPKKQVSGAASLKNSGELYSSVGNQVFESKDFGKYN